MSGPDAPQIASGLLHSQAPVIVTFDGDAVVDVFGDLAYFTQADDREDLLRLLRDLLVGQDDTAPLLRAVELSPGKYADVHVVPEGELRHLVLLDATAGVLEARELQQTKNEASLAGHQLKRELIARDQEHQDELRRQREKEQSLRHRLDMLERISDDVRARLGALVGHARVLVPNCTDDPGAMRTLGQIQHTAVYLEAQLLNYAEYLRSQSQSVGPAAPEPIALKFLAGELERLFGLGEEHGLSIEVVSEAGLGAAVEMDYPRVYQLLITLIALAFDSVSRRRVAVRLDAPGGDLLIGLDARVDWDIEALAVGAGPLDGLQAGDASVQFGLHACRRLVQSMDGQFSIGMGENEPGLTRIRILLPQPASRQVPRSTAAAGRRAVVAIDEPQLAASVTALLPEIGLEPRAVAAVDAFEAAACAPDTGLVVLSDNFAGESGAGLVYRLHDLGARTPVVLLSRQQAWAASSGWQRKRHRVVVAADAGREVLAAALRDAAENGAID
jgi:hypothetical protein